MVKARRYLCFFFFIFISYFVNASTENNLRENNSLGLIFNSKDSLYYNIMSYPFSYPKYFHEPTKSNYHPEVNIIKMNSLDMYKSGYIVEFENEPLIVRKAKTEKDLLLNFSNFMKDYKKEEELKHKLISYENELHLEKERIKNEILEKRSSFKGKSIIESSSENIFLGEYSYVFYGIAINVSEEEIEEIKKIRGVKKIWPNTKVKKMIYESVPLIQESIPAGLLDVNGDNCINSRNKCLTGEGITIAIIDTGVDYSHPDLGNCTKESFLSKNCPKVIGGYDFINGDNDPMDDHGHGTHCAGIAAGNGSLKGVAPGSKILAYKALDSNGMGNYDSIISSIERAILDGADILSLSLGGPGKPDDPLSTAVDNAVLAGKVVVVAAGNIGPNYNTILSPGTSKKAITVGYSTKNNLLSFYSSRGPVIWTDNQGEEKAIIKPDIIAPGEMICSARWQGYPHSGNCGSRDEEHIFNSGSSMATPHIAGAVAILKQKNSSWSPEEIKSILKRSAIDLFYDINEQGAGRINISKALKFKSSPVLILDNNYSVRGIINISGTVKFSNKYEVYYANLEDNIWKLICSKNKEVINGVLCENFDTSLVRQGDSLLKLVARNNEDILFEEISPIKFNNFFITSVGDSENYTNARNLTPIYGEIKLENYDSYTIELKTTDPNLGEIWVPICSSKSRGIFSGILCLANFSNLSDGKYNIRLSINKSNKNKINGEKFKFAVINSLLEGWPIKEPFFWSTFIIPINLERTNIVSTESTYGIFNFLQGPQISFYDSSKRKIVLQDLYDKKKDIVTKVKSLSSFPSINKQDIALSSLYYAIGTVDYEGNFLYNWPFYTEEKFGAGFFIILKDKVFEIYYKANNPEEIFLYGFWYNGSILDRFPKRIELEENFNKWAISRGKILIIDSKEEYIGFVIALYDNDYQKNKLYLDIYSAKDGSRIKRVLLDQSLDEKLIFYPPYFYSADLNGDGNTEIIVAYFFKDREKYYQNISDPKAYKNYVKIFDSKGNPISQPFQIEGYELKDIVISDLGRNQIEIIMSLGETYATEFKGDKVISINMQGITSFEINIDPYRSTGEMVVGNVFGDDSPEIVIPYTPSYSYGDNSGILIYNSSGKLKKEIIIPTLGKSEYFSYFYGGSPILIDFTGNGKTEIIIKSLHIQTSSSIHQSNIFVFETNVTFNDSKMEWPMFYFDPQHTGCYKCSNKIKPEDEKKENDYKKSSGGSSSYSKTEEKTKKKETYIPVNYIVSQTSLREGVTFRLIYEDKLIFSVLENIHTLTLNKFNLTHANVTIQSEPIELLLEKGKTYEFDLTGDRKKDVRVRYEGINEEKASIFIQKISLIKEINIINKEDDKLKEKRNYLLDFIEEIKNKKYFSIIFFNILFIFSLIFIYIIFIIKNSLIKKKS